MRKKLAALSTGLSLFCMAAVAQAATYNFTTIDVPGALETIASCIDGENIAGYYRNASGYHGYLYNGSNFTTIDVPGASNTIVTSIDDGNIVGFYWASTEKERGFLYNGMSFINIDYPGALENVFDETYVRGIKGENILVTYYNDENSRWHSYLYNGVSFTLIDYPGATNTEATGIDGGNIVGIWDIPGGGGTRGEAHGYLYDGSSFTTIDVPGALETSALCIDGGNIVGGFQDTSGNFHGYLYDGSSFTTIDVPGALETITSCIDGGNIVGSFQDTSGNFHGFIATSTALTNALTTTESDCLFNWGEDNYPSLLSPNRPTPQFSSPYYFRHYTGSNTYLGYSSADEHLYFLDANGSLIDLGLAATWSTTAGCR